MITPASALQTKLTSLRMIFTLKLVLLVSMLFLFAPLTLANSKQMVAEIEAKRITANDPMQMLIDAEAFITQTDSNSLPFLYASVFKLEALVFQERFQEADELLKQLKVQANQQNDSLIAARLAMQELKINFAEGNPKNYQHLFENAVTKAMQSDNMRAIAEAHMNVGLQQYKMLNYSHGILSLKKAYDISSEFHQEALQSAIVIALANCYSDLGEIDLAITYYTEALGIYQSQQSPFGESVVLYNIGKAQFANNNFDDAYVNFEKAKQISIQIDDEIGVLLSELQIAEIYFTQKLYTDAQPLFTKVERSFREMGSKSSHFQALLGLIKTNLALNNLIKVNNQLPLLSELVQGLDNDVESSQYTLVRSKIAAREGSYELAYDYLDKTRAIEAKITEQKINTEAQKYKVDFETALTQQKNQLLIQENEINNLVIQQQKEKEKVWIIVILLSIISLIALLSLLFSQIRNREKFQKLALVDSLTKSPNRRAILDFAKVLFEEAESMNTQFCLAIVDLDLFKEINDTYGHQVGDEVLIAFAQSCQKSIREHDNFGRYGGEEWLIVFPKTTVENAKFIFPRLSTTLNEQPLHCLPKEHKLTFSIGMVEYKSNHYESLDEMIIAADECLYKAKQLGRNRMITKNK